MVEGKTEFEHICSAIGRFWFPAIISLTAVVIPLDSYVECNLRLGKAGGLACRITMICNRYICG